MAVTSPGQQVIIVGNGPAGISAALYTTRAGFATTILGRDGGALEKTDEIENYYGFAQPISGPQLLQNGCAQARRLGARLLQAEVVDLTYGNGLLVKTTVGEYPADAVILATGAARKLPPITGLKEFEGRGVSHCAMCDAFFYRGKDVAVLGSGEFALHEVGELLPVVGSVTMLTGGQPAPAGRPPALHVVTKSIASVFGGNLLAAVNFEDGSSLPLSGLFVAVGVAGSTALALKLGAMVENNAVLVDEHMATNVPGLFAAGDCTGGFTQVAKAVYQGAVAGASAVKYLRAAVK